MMNKLAFIIEDDFDGSMVFAKAAEANGLEPEQIMTGNRALERIGESVPTLVVLDLHLPVVPGPDILKKIRADSRLADTLVVVVTADPRMAEIIRDEADLVLLKPTTFSQVRDLLGRLLALRERNSKPATPPPAAEPEKALAAAEAKTAEVKEPEAGQPEVKEAAEKPVSNGEGPAVTAQPAAEKPVVEADSKPTDSAKDAKEPQTEEAAKVASPGKAEVAAPTPKEATVAAEKPSEHSPAN